MVLNHLYGLIEPQSDDTQYNDAGDYHIQLENLGAVDDQVTQSPPRGKEFPDDHTHQRQADIYLRGAQ